MSVLDLTIECLLNLSDLYRIARRS